MREEWNLLGDMSKATSVEQFRQQMGEFLHLEHPVTERAALACVLQPDYARRLLAARGHPAMLEHLLAAAPQVDRRHSRFRFQAEDAPASDGAPARMDGLSSARLVAEASKSLLRWAVSGFTPVDDATYERRLNACVGCEHLTRPDDRLIYKLATAFDASRSVCGLCGCVVAKKARVPHEACPGTDPHDERRTRWGDEKN
ncbi:hypothetical protein [Burkholderia pyrrocinia]|uniref:hypothetical protein n=1 Tax=Burkholderia pyrrocinia TaxID=60550 RepID=UPI000B13ADBD|nr:hypothetical protein [Burkholderia pyrrocinia]